MNNPNERRNSKRRNFNYYMPITDDDSQELVGHLTDISDFGIRADCLKAQMINQNYRLRLELTSDIADKPFIIFSARAKWCREDKLTPNTYNVGFQIINLDPGDVRIINRLMEKYGTE